MAEKKVVSEADKESAKEMAKLVSELSHDDKNIVLGIVKGLLISKEIKEKNDLKTCKG